MILGKGLCESRVNRKANADEVVDGDDVVAVYTGDDLGSLCDVRVLEHRSAAPITAYAHGSKYCRELKD